VAAFLNNRADCLLSQKLVRLVYMYLLNRPQPALPKVTVPPDFTTMVDLEESEKRHAACDECSMFQICGNFNLST
jgi:hypothetical protein